MKKGGFTSTSSGCCIHEHIHIFDKTNLDEISGILLEITFFELLAEQ